jgi:hypothetical protein
VQNSLFHLAGAAFDGQRHPRGKIALDEKGLVGFGKLDTKGRRGSHESVRFSHLIGVDQNPKALACLEQMGAQLIK